MDHISELKKNMDELANMFSSRMAAFEHSISPTATGDNSTLQDFQSFKSFVLKAISSLKSQMECVFQAIDGFETRSRSNVLLLHGMAESSNEPVTEDVLKVMTEDLQLSDVTLTSLVACHRLGKIVSTENPRPILIRFTNPHTRNLVWSSKRKLKGTGLTVSEFLTPTRHAVFVAARKIYGVKDCWTVDGKIVIIGANGTRHKITSMSELRAIDETSNTTGKSSSNLASSPDISPAPQPDRIRVPNKPRAAKSQAKAKK